MGLQKVIEDATDEWSNFTADKSFRVDPSRFLVESLSKSEAGEPIVISQMFIPGLKTRHFLLKEKA